MSEEFEIMDGWVKHNCPDLDNDGILEFTTALSGLTIVRCRYCNKTWRLDEFIRELTGQTGHDGDRYHICKSCGQQYTESISGKDGYCFNCWREAEEETKFRHGSGLGW